MKKIIDGKKYNTETAQKMGGHDNGTLYRKKTGEFFLHGEGEQIIPQAEKEAEEWAKAHLKIDEYEAIFGEVGEDYSDTNVNFTITVRSHQILRRLQTRTGKTMGGIVNELIEVEGKKYNL